MLNAKSYFLHQIRQYLRPMLIIIAITLLIGSGVTALNDYTYELHYGHDVQEYLTSDHRYYIGNAVYVKSLDVESYKINEISLGYPVTVMMIMAAVAPGWMFCIFKKKRNLDCFYSLPISRRTLGMIQYGLGLIAVFLPFVLTYAQAILANIAGGYFENLAHQHILYHFLLSILAGFVMYTLSAFVFNLANTSSDGYIFMFAYQAVPAFIISCIENMIYSYYSANNQYPFDSVIYQNLSADYGSNYLFFGETLSDLARKVERKYPDPYYDVNFSEDYIWLWIIVWTIVGVLALYGLYKLFALKRADQAEEISDTIFGYKTLVPICGVIGILSELNADLYYSLLMFTAVVIGYTFYRRGVRYKKPDVIVMAATFFLSIFAPILYVIIF